MTGSQSNTQITLQIIGGGQEIGANSYLLNWKGKTILLDTGMHPNKPADEARISLDNLPTNIDAVIITHGHFDHIGSLPFLYDKRNIKHIFVQNTAAPIIGRMLRNSIGVESRRLNESRGHRNERYQKLDELIEQMNLGRFSYREKFTIAGDIQGFFFDAGHVLGSAGIVITDGTYTVVYTGDISLHDHGIHYKAHLPASGKTNLLIMESTTGVEAKETNQKEQLESFYQYINDSIKRKGQILIPAFALGRTQDVIGVLAQGIEQGRIPELPIFSGGLGENITHLYDDEYPQLRRYYEKLKLAEYVNFLQGKDLIHAYERFHQEKKSAVFIVTNGMMVEETVSARIARRILPRENDSIIFSGYQAPGTKGYDVLKAPTGSDIFFKEDDIPHKVTIKTPHRYIVRFSAHASRQDLVDIAENFQPELTALIHGDKEATQTMAKILHKKNFRTELPEAGETLLLQRNGEAQNISFREKEAIIITVGTSLIGNAKRAGVDTTNGNELSKFLQNAFNESKAPSAEIQSLRELRLKGIEYLYFIATDSEEGKIAAELQSLFYQEQGFRSSTVLIPGLTQNYEEFQSRGLPNFIHNMVRLLNVHQGKVKVLATGGFKAQTGFATLLGTMMGAPVYYIHEDFAHLIQFPAFPVSPDLREYELLHHSIETILNSPSPEKQKNILENSIPPAFQFIFQEKKEGGYFLNPSGELLKHLFIASLNRKRKSIRLFAAKNQVHLFGSGPIPIDEIPNDQIRLMFYRIFQHDYLIEKIQFKDILSNKGSEPCLILEKETKQELLYRLYAPEGEELISIRSYNPQHLKAQLGSEIHP